MAVEESYMLNIFMSRRKSAEQIYEAIQGLISDRKQRRVVTPSGRRVRGHFPSLKSEALQTRFESGLELSVLEMLEVAKSVRNVKTHPYTLRFDNGEEKSTHYTPDFEVLTADGLMLIEAKGVPYLRDPKEVSRHQQIARGLKRSGIPFATVLSSDLADWPYTKIVTDLLKERPWPRCGTRTLVGGSLPGLDLEHCTEDFARRWAAAAKECDALLARLMKRGPDETIAAAR
jgi:hypothetical protein